MSGTGPDQLDRRERAAVVAELVDGYRIVDGGQISADGAWEIQRRTVGEQLAHGDGYQSYEDAWHDNWVHTDALGDEAMTQIPAPDDDFGLPAGLVEALKDWIATRPQEAKATLSR